MSEPTLLDQLKARWPNLKVKVTPLTAREGWYVEVAGSDGACRWTWQEGNHGWFLGTCDAFQRIIKPIKKKVEKE